MTNLFSKIVGERRTCKHVTPDGKTYGYDHPPWPHSCDGCFCEGPPKEDWV